MDAEELKLAAALTEGGKSYTIRDADRLARELPEGRQVVIESMEPFVLWNWFPVPLLALILLFSEWVLRKSRGLL